MGIELSWATLKDVDDLARLDELGNRDNSFWEIQSKADFRNVIRRSKYLTIVAKRDGEAVAYLQSGLRNTKRHLWVENLFVKSELRRTGIAKAMMTKFVNQWKGKVDYIVLLSADETVDVFERLGFEKEMNYMGYRHSKGKTSKAKRR